MVVDHFDEILEQWERERPDLDLSSIGLFGRITRVARVMEKGIEAVFAEHGLQGGRFGVLAALRRSGPPYRLSPTALYDTLLVTSGAMTDRLDRLVAEGFITRTPDDDDRRSMLVVLTDKGRQRIDETYSAHVRREQELLAFLSEEERLIFITLLRKLALELGDKPRLWPAPDHAQDVVAAIAT